MTRTFNILGLLCLLLLGAIGGAGAQTAFVSSDFHGTAGQDVSTYTPAVGGAWVNNIYTGGYSSAGNTVFTSNGAANTDAAPAPGTNNLVYTSPAAIPNSTYTATMVVTVASLVNATQISIAATDGPQNSIRFGYYNASVGNSGNGWQIQTVATGGGPVNVAGPVAGTFGVGSHTLVLSVTGGTSYTLTVDGTAIFTNVTVTTYTPTRVGFHAYGTTATAGTGFHVASFVASTATVATPVSAAGVSFSNVTGTSLTVTTSAATGGTGTGYTYQFQRAPDTAGVAGTYANIGTASSALSFADSGLTAGAKYWYRVITTDSATASGTGVGRSQVTASHSASTFYVSSTGSGSGNGLSTGAPLTLAQANSTAWVPGDSILFDGANATTGTFTLSASGTAAALIKVGPYNGAAATLLAGDQSGLVLSDVSYVRVSGLTVTGAGVLAAGVMADATKLRRPLVEIVSDLSSGTLGHLSFQNLTLSNGYSGLWLHCTASTTPVIFATVDIGGLVVHDCLYFGVWTSGSEATAGQTMGSPYYYSKGSGVSGLHLHDFNIYNIYGGTVTGYTSTATSGLADTTDNVRTLNGTGVLLGGVVGGVIERGIMTNVGQNNSCQNGGPVGIWTYEASGLVCQYLESYGNKSASVIDGGGFDFDGGTTNSVYQYCYSHDNGGAGFQAGPMNGSDACAGLTFRYNIGQNDCRTSGTGEFYTFGAAGLTIYNNTAYMGTGLVAHSVVNFSGTTTLYNNLLLSQNVPIFIGPLGCTLSANDYYNYSGAISLVVGGTTYTSFATWGGDPLGLSADPLLSAPGAGGTVGSLTTMNRNINAYDLASTSPAVDAGVGLLSLGLSPGPLDFHLNASLSGASQDIGAVEYGAPRPGGTTAATTTIKRRIQ